MNIYLENAKCLLTGGGQIITGQIITRQEITDRIITDQIISYGSKKNGYFGLCIYNINKRK